MDLFAFQFQIWWII